MSKIIVENIYAEDLFKWFYEHIGDSCGNGTGVIVCENYKDVANWFIEWFCKNFNVKENGDYVVLNKDLNKKHIIHLGNKKFWHSKDEYDNIINFHDKNENFMFTNDINIKMFDGNYIFIIKEDCQFVCKSLNLNKVIKKIKLF